MNKHTSNSQLKVDGKMTPEGANRVGLVQAISYVILAASALILAIAALIMATK